MEPGEAAFHDPAQPAEARAVGGATAGDDRGDAALTQQLAVLVVVIAAVGVDLAGASSRPAAPAADRWDRVQERHQLGDVVAVAAGQDHCQGMPAASAITWCLLPSRPGGPGWDRCGPPVERT